MTRRIRFVQATLAAPALLALAGCAAVPTPQNDRLDDARMEQIERAAVRSGVKVIWVNAPRKAVAGG